MTTHSGKIQPLDWNFSSCPESELAVLFCYEFSRECQSVRDNVAFIRHGTIEPSSYWSPSPEFGWPEWPQHPYLLVPPVERQRRLAQLLAPTPAALVVRVITELPLGTTVWEQQLAIARVALKQGEKTKEKIKGRRSAIATRHDQLRALSVYRLRQYYTARQILDLLSEHYRKIVYSDPTSVNRAVRQAPKFIAAFSLRAHDRMRHGLWFPPFGPQLIES